MLKELGLKMGLKLRRLGGGGRGEEHMEGDQVASYLARNAHRCLRHWNITTLWVSVGDTFHVCYCVKPQVSL